MAAKPVKIIEDLYKQIVRLISKPDFKYKYPSISAFVNEAVYNKLKEIKTHGIFGKIRI